MGRIIAPTIRQSDSVPHTYRQTEDRKLEETGRKACGTAILIKEERLEADSVEGEDYERSDRLLCRQIPMPTRPTMI